jgi:hypothetical protein
VFLKSHKAGGHTYWSVVESHRERGKIKHRRVHYLGRRETREDAQRAWDEIEGVDPAPVEPDPVIAGRIWDADRRAKVDRLRAGAGSWAKFAEDMAGAEDDNITLVTARLLWESLDPYAKPDDRDQWERVPNAWEHEFDGRRPHSGSSHPPWAAVLGVPWPATLDQVKAAYRGKAKEVHPDRGGSHEAAVVLNRAYEEALKMLTRDVRA